MRIVIFGLTISSSWGNGHATLWRSLVRALGAAGHEVEFFERDTPYYAGSRDLHALPPPGQLRVYGSWDEIRAEAAAAADAADVAIVTSYQADGRAASELVLGSRAGVRVFYDLDTPVTLVRLLGGEDVPYLPAAGLADFDLVLSFTGGRALDLLRDRLGARRVATLYGSVDPDVHHAVPPRAEWTGACSYLGTWSADRQRALDALFIAVARRRPERRFVLGGSQYPADLAWPANVACFEHVAPPDHACFYSSSPVTINVTRGPMAEMGYCPSGRLFEAAACGVPVVSDVWEGLDTFFTPGEEILFAHTTDDALAAIDSDLGALRRIGARARERALDEHSGRRRAAELVATLEGVRT